MISVLQAQTQILGSPVSLKKEKITSVSSLKRVLAENLICDRDTPPFDRATMDGIAVCWDKEIKTTSDSLYLENCKQEMILPVSLPIVI